MNYSLPKKINLLSITIFLVFCGCGQVQFARVEEKKTEPIVVPPTSEDVDAQETFLQDATTVRKIDILFVDDNSGSMAEEQKEMGQKFNAFLSGLGAADWQVGITTTDVSSGTYGIQGSLIKLWGRPDKILTKSTPDFLKVFENTIRRPESIDCINGCLRRTNSRCLLLLDLWKNSEPITQAFLETAPIWR